MKVVQKITDQFSIGLSLLCAIHCLFLPLLLVLLPGLGALQFDNEAFHLWILIAVIPISLIALSLGCKKHDSFSLFILGSTGLMLLLFAAIWGHELVGDAGEKVLTLIGSSLVAIAHFVNLTRCKRNQSQCNNA